MGFRIIGDNGQSVNVTGENQLAVRAIDETELEHASSIGSAYAWDSGSRDIDVGDTMLFVKNLSATTLILDRAMIFPANVLCSWDINLGSATTTPTGTAASEVNLNVIFASTLADVVARYDEGAVADGSTVHRAIVQAVATATSEAVIVNLNGVILGKNHYIQFNQETESTSGSVILIGHFANPE